MGPGYLWIRFGSGYDGFTGMWTMHVATDYV
jgi:hypothetical protein